MLFDENIYFVTPRHTYEIHNVAKELVGRVEAVRSPMGIGGRSRFVVYDGDTVSFTLRRRGFFRVRFEMSSPTGHLLGRVVERSSKRNPRLRAQLVDGQRFAVLGSPVANDFEVVNESDHIARFWNDVPKKVVPFVPYSFEYTTLVEEHASLPVRQAVLASVVLVHEIHMSSGDSGGGYYP